MKNIDNKKTEEHPLFPSGEWTGFYIYSFERGARYMMPCSFTFFDNQVTGFGADDVGSFTWRGIYDKEKLTCKLTKSYLSHKVHYSGQVDENGIWGEWEISPSCKGGFHLWPVSTHANEELVEEESEVIQTGCKIHFMQ